jgi:CubicO group peptidase (beta-lactamase class C family)
MRTLLTVAYLFSLASAACYDPSSAFPVPLWQKNAHALEPAFRVIETALDALGSDDKYNSTSFSVEVTSQSETLWTYHHSAREHNKTRPGVTHVNGDSQYRIASITKTFTVLGVLYQHAAGNLSLDDPVDQYIAELSGPESGVLPWKDITLRSLASQLSGIPREMDQADLLNEVPDPTKLGLPPVDRKGVPDCYEYNEYEKPCNRTQLLKYFLQKQPLFAPNQQSTYSNVAYELLGLVLENVTGLPYEEYMEQAIFKPLNLSSTTLSKPSDSHAVLPLGQYFWDVAQGVHSPTGGIYSSSSDMSAYCRYVLTHYNALATGVNWFLPASWGTNLQNFYGMPWEIFRTDKMLDNTKRPVTLVTKAGGVPSYFSRMSLLPEYGLGIAILVGGDNRVLAELQEAVTLSLVRAAEAAVWKDVESIYTGSYTAVEPSGLNSSATFGSDSLLGLTLETFISNSTDVFETLLPTFAGVRRGQPWHAQLVPTLLYKNQTTQQGEIWRLLIVPERTSKDEVLDDWCNTDIDVANYAGLPINEVVFWHEENEVELPAWRVRMRRSEQPTLDDKAKFVVQQG